MPLLGVSMSPLQLVSDWMPAGDLPKYIKGHPDADLVGLVGLGLRRTYPTLIHVSSLPASLEGCATSIRAV